MPLLRTGSRRDRFSRESHGGRSTLGGSNVVVPEVGELSTIRKSFASRALNHFILASTGVEHADEVQLFQAASTEHVRAAQLHRVLQFTVNAVLACLEFLRLLNCFSSNKGLEQRLMCAVKCG